MLYASTRSTLTKSLGATSFTDSMFATTKDELSAEAYEKHRRNLNAPQLILMSEREKELAAVKASELEVGGAIYEGSSGRRNHVGMPVGNGKQKWSEEVVDALKKLGAGDASQLLLLVSAIAISARSISSKSIYTESRPYY